MSGVTLENAVKRYGETQVIHGVDLQIDDGEFCVFVGPSGCGKSTLLRMIAGLEDTTEGKISIGDRDVTQADPSERGVAMVFQTYALYPHMSVEQNMGFGLKMNKVPKAIIDEKVNKAADILKLGPYMKRKPKALSGGQRQRVAIGRAIVRGPEVFMFDEPLSNLDAELRVDMRVEIARLHKELGATMIYVTHDQVEAMTLADKIVVLRDGHIEQVGRPMDLYQNPNNKFVAGFIGSPSMNFINGVVDQGKVRVPGLDNICIETNVALPADGAPIIIGVRPQHLKATIRPSSDLSQDNPAHIRVDLRERLGGVAYDYLTTPTGERIVIETNDDEDIQGGTAVSVTLDPKNAMFFDTNTEARLR